VRDRGAKTVGDRGIATFNILVCLLDDEWIAFRVVNEGPDSVETAVAWFHAINTDDVNAARALFMPSQRQQIAWLDQPRSDLSTFSNLHCRSTSTSAEHASVLCTFKESASPTEGNPDAFWSVYMQRASTGGWLINNYGQP
jgi:hypothetical protein